ncbi:MAG: HPr(Ser) kinase/phosphatase [Verrucomicrobia bacterium]|jgi:HPr kinase/phosphorylase|nr:HPr(Ser) kinase/phosphatase [Verrucomicrobiota bacterium]
MSKKTPHKNATSAVTVEQLVNEHDQELQLHPIGGAHNLKRKIREPTVNRPGLALVGFKKYFASKRVQVFGSVETTYLRSLSPQERAECYRWIFATQIPCVVYSRNLNPDGALLKAAQKAKVPVFKTPLITMRFINLATLALEMMFAPKCNEIGGMVDILGVGVIIRGDSGIGKSEAVLALVERGYSLVADDITIVTRIDNHYIVGTSNEMTRNLMEIRGIGIIDVAAMFGVRSFRTEKQVNLVVTLAHWDKLKEIDRLGIDNDFVEILDVEIPHITIPVRPGRDLARLIEVAAFQTKLKMSGINTAKALSERLLNKMTRDRPSKG